MTSTALESYVDRVKPRSVANVLLWVVILFFVVFIAWAALTKLDQTVRAPGRVVPSSQLQIVSNLEGGIVEAILVKTGDLVRRGDPLIRLDQTETGAAFSSSDAKFDALRVRIARLEGEVTGQAPRFPATGGAGLGEQIAIERGLYASRMSDLRSTLAAAQSRVIQAQRSVSEAQASLDSRRAAHAAARNELSLVRPLVERGIEPQLSLVRAESEASIASSNVAAASASLSRAYSQVSEAQSSLAQQRQDWRSQAAQELAAAQAEMVSLRSTLPALSERVQRAIIRSPLAGRVNRVLTSTVGGTVRPGEPLVEVVPSEEQLIIEAQVDPKDIAWVRLGQSARINITAYDPAVYGALEGSVLAISPDATIDEKTDESYYLVRVSTSDQLRGRDGRPLEIGPGMIAQVSLLGEKRSILDYILAPLTKMNREALRE